MFTFIDSKNTTHTFDSFVLRGMKAAIAITKIKNWVLATNQLQAIQGVSLDSNNLDPEVAEELMKSFTEGEIGKDFIDLNAKKEKLIIQYKGKETEESKKLLNEVENKLTNMMSEMAMRNPKILKTLFKKGSSLDQKKMAQEEELEQLLFEGVQCALIAMNKEGELVNEMDKQTAVLFTEQVILEPKNLIHYDTLFISTLVSKEVAGGVKEKKVDLQ